MSLANHLWQSTVFAGLAALLTLMLRKNRARVRHCVWLAASVKFLIPLSVMVELGSHIHWRTPTEAPVRAYLVIEEVSQPFTAAIAPPAQQRRARDPLPAVLWTIWACGFLGISAAWWLRWRRLRAAVRAGSPLQLDLPVPAISSAALLEPGVFGIFRPVLLLPEGILERLTPAQLEAVILHELCHVRHRDNFAAAIHMFVETVFWFHPLVWWIGKRMVAERERACDEEVLQLGSDPRAYAEGILNICKLYAESPLACVSGVTGADLKGRIEAILSKHAPARLRFAQKAALTLAAAAVVAFPLIVGVLNAPAIRAQSAPQSTPKFEVASVKPCTPQDVPPADGARNGGRGAGGGGALGDPGLFRTPCVPVHMLIQTAYIRFASGQAGVVSPLKDNPIQGPSWIDAERYVIDAKPERPQTHAMMAGPMLQALLEDRFKLKLHRESKEIPVYALVVARGGAKIEPTKPGDCTPHDPDSPPPAIVPGQPLPCGYIDGDPNGIKAVGVPILTICGLTRSQVRRKVIDKTGLTGLYNFHLDFNIGPPNSAPAEDDPAMADQLALVGSALQKLGLKLEPAKATGEFLVIDHIERPTVN